MVKTFTLAFLMFFSMVTFGLLVAITLASQALLVQGAAINRKGQSKELPVAQTTTGCRFCHCRSSTTRDAAVVRLCIMKTLEKERASGGVLRMRRSLGSKLHPKSTVEDVDALLLTGGKHRLPRSLEALCAGDISQYDHEVREYIQWRCKNGYGQLMRRWGRAAAPSADDDRHFRSSENMVEQTGTGSVDDGSKVRRYNKLSSYKWRAKRDDDEDLRAIVEAYREWRSQNGYGQTSGRWG